MRLLSAWLVLCVAGAACGGPARFALLPGMRMGGRDPDPTRPLVEHQVAPPRNEDGGRPRTVTVGKVDVAVTGATLLGWLLGGAAPLVGVYGEFDENSWFLRKPPPPAEEPEGEAPAPR